MMQVVFSERINIIKDVKILINDGLKYKRIELTSFSKKNPQDKKDIHWYSTKKDVLQDTQDKDWKEMNYNDGNKMELLYKELLTNKK